ncbi:LURP-one-related/scramblase family protein [Lactiplantibacillus daowaiensis]|uniref:LURP-one-related/scramblase family protein n=1 Tax=Lactiplantibacillus daowaiensis TaxID=2559918 RepID=A0ABW1S0V5_9LACO|nr:LURP-one-related family protein [Lactiplantibacillus daowaiensis]
MRQLYINQKILSFRDRYAVLDAQSEPVYQVTGSLFSIPKHFDIENMAGSVVARVTKKPIAWLPRFYLEIDGRQVATLQKRMTVLRAKYTLSALNLTVTGDFWDMNFEVARNGQVIGSVAKRYFSIGDKYEITILDDADERLLVGLVVAIDYVKRSEAAAASASVNS